MAVIYEREFDVGVLFGGGVAVVVVVVAVVAVATDIVSMMPCGSLVGVVVGLCRESVNMSLNEVSWVSVLNP